MSKIMQQTLSLFFLCLLVFAGLAGCSDQPAANAGEDPAASSGEEAVAEAYVFSYQGTEIPMNAPAAPIVEKLGEALSYFEAESCAFQGIDRTYTYSGIQINTYPLEETDYISSVLFTDDSVSTPEGLEIGSSREDMIAAYGEDYVEEYGQYTYTKGDSQISILLEDGTVTAIEYLAVLPE